MLALLAVPLFLVTRPALATSPCGASVIKQTQPADGAVDVPVDAVFRVLLQYDAGDCGGSNFDQAEVELRADGDVVAAVTTRDWQQFIQLDPDADLLPNTTYSVSVKDAEESRSFQFTTGERRIGAQDAAPTLEILELVHDSGFELSEPNTTFHIGTLRLTPGAADPDGLSLLRIVETVGDEPSSAGNLPFGSADPQETLVVAHARFEDEICYRVVHVTGNGAEIPSELVCAQSLDDDDRFDELGGDSLKEQSGSGCSASRGFAGGGSAFSMLALVVGALLRRRRELWTGRHG
jgi:uncharacterized protein (TIGR03382 family)